MTSVPFLVHLFLSPGHNFVGRHGRPAGAHPMVSVPEVRCVAGRGLEGDRFFDYKPVYRGHEGGETHDYRATLRALRSEAL